MRRWLRIVPLSLTVLRALLAPIVVGLALAHPSPVGFAWCLILAFLSDVFDGIIARRLKVATPALRRFDSVADSLFYTAALFAAWHLYPNELRAHFVLLAVLVGLEFVRYSYDFWKFKREASYHMWFSKLWGIALFAGFSALLVWGVGKLWVTSALIIGIAADIEGLAISLILDQWQTDVPSLYHALRARRLVTQSRAPRA